MSDQPRARAAEQLLLPDGGALRLYLEGVDRARNDGLRLRACEAAGDVVGTAAYTRVYGPRAQMTISLTTPTGTAACRLR